MFSKRHYEMLANWIGKNYPDRQPGETALQAALREERTKLWFEMVHSLVHDVLTPDNPKFDGGKFMKAISRS